MAKAHIWVPGDTTLHEREFKRSAPNRIRAAICRGFAVAAILTSTSSFAADLPTVEEDGTIHLPSIFFA